MPVTSRSRRRIRAVRRRDPGQRNAHKRHRRRGRSSRPGSGHPMRPRRPARAISCSEVAYSRVSSAGSGAIALPKRFSSSEARNQLILLPIDRPHLRRPARGGGQGEASAPLVGPQRHFRSLDHLIRPLRPAADEAGDRNPTRCIPLACCATAASGAARRLPAKTLRSIRRSSTPHLWLTASCRRDGAGRPAREVITER